MRNPLVQRPKRKRIYYVQVRIPVSKDWWSQSPTRLAEDDGTQQMILIDTE
jgi:hypothetical protein